MIKKFGFRNFYSFKEYSEISFELDNNVPDDISRGRKINTVIGVKGGNGSGKTNIIKALSFFLQFCLDNVSSKDKEDRSKDKGIPFKAFFDSDNVTEFNIELEIEGISYIYELELTTKRIINEVLIRKKNREVILFERSGNSVEKSIKEYSELKTIYLRDDQSVISAVDKFKFKSDLLDINKVYTHFIVFFSNVNASGYFDLTINLDRISERYHESPKAFEFIKNILVAADDGIHDVTISSRDDEDGKKIYYPSFKHKNNNDYFTTTYKEESSGTKALFKKMYLYWFVLENGGFLAFDEFDIHIHANILPLIVDLFLNKESNPKNAQFIFTAHNTEIINKMGRYMTVLVNKEDSESYCYRLDEIKGTMLRNDRPISPIYLDGKIGGVPKINCVHSKD